MIKSHTTDWGDDYSSMDFLYGDAVLHAAGQQDQVWRLHSFIVLDDVLLDLLQLSSELVNQPQSLVISEVLLHVVAQRNLDRTGEAIKGRRGKINQGRIHICPVWFGLNQTSPLCGPFGPV